MFSSVIRKLFLHFLMALFTIFVNAQKPHFIYLQTEGGQPFYAKFNNKLISSSSEGFIIIPGVTDGVYDLVVGFPRNEFPEKDYTIAVNNVNEGYLLKNLNENGWQLFDMQTLTLIKGTDTKPPVVIVKKDEDSFTKMLAGVVKDSSILQNHDSLAVASSKKPDASPIVNADSAKVIVQVGQKINSSLNGSDTTSGKNEAPSSLAVASPTSPMKKDSAITRILNESNEDGVQMMYQVKNDSSNTDTVIIFMPVQKNNVDSNIIKSATGENINIPAKTDSSQFVNNQGTSKLQPQSDSIKVPLPSASIDTAIKNNSLSNNGNVVANIPVSASNSSSKARDSAIANIVGEKKEDSVSGANNLLKANTLNSMKEGSTNTTRDRPPADQLIVLPKEVTVSRVNSDCKYFATTEDFLKLRKKMAAEGDMDNMLKVAKKYFKLKCYSTEQIKDLSYLFLTDEGKYKFFDEAYAFTSDSDQYPTLQLQFIDKYYLNRFKAMIGR